MSTNKMLLSHIDFANDSVPDLHDLMDQLRPHGTVVPVKFHGERAWLINDFETLSRVFSDEVHFQSAATYLIHGEPAMGLTLQTMAGEKHRINRGLVSRPFFPREVRQLVESLIEPVANELLDELEGCDEVEFLEAFSRPFPFRVITRLLGIPLEDEPRLLEWALKLFEYPWDPEGAVKARYDFADYMKPFLDARRSAPSSDVISMLASSEFEGQRLTDEEIFSFVRLLYPAGSDTAYKNGGSLLLTILTQPGLRELVLQGEAEREAIVQEGLRCEPPVALLPRICSEDVTLGGVDIAKGEWALFSIAAANRDPRVFDDPHVFDPARVGKNLVFGQGVHFCLGSHLARRELEASIKLIFQRFPNIRLLPGQTKGIVGGVLRGPEELWVTLRG